MWSRGEYYILLDELGHLLDSKEGKAETAYYELFIKERGEWEREKERRGCSSPAIGGGGDKRDGAITVSSSN